MSSIKSKKINGKEYLYAEYSFRLPDGKIKKLSKLIKETRKAESKEVSEYFINKEIESNQKFALSKYRPGTVFTKEKIEKLERVRVEFRHLMRKIPKMQMKDLVDRFTVNFTYETNALEGNSLTLKDVTLLLTENITPEGKDLRDVFETINTREVHDILFRKKIKIESNEIIKLHSILVNDTGVSPGFKKFPNFLVMRNLKTTLPENVEREMKKLIEYYHTDKEKVHPLQLAAAFHAAFERIHPFEDGNGRMGRTLINAMLMERGYPPLIIRKTERRSYFSALEAADNGHIQKLERFLIKKMEKTFTKFFGVYVKYL